MVFGTSAIFVTAACAATIAHGLGLHARLPLSSRMEEDHAPDATFTAHLLKHRMTPPSDPLEFQERLALFRERTAEVEKHNSNANRRWTAGLNHLSDRTHAERKRLLGHKATKAASQNTVPTSSARNMLSKKPIPQEKSWTSYSNQQFIRDQGQCGSCWAVAASTVLDAHSEIWATNQSFSTQEIVDCVPNPNKCGGTGGCDGATVELAMQYAMMKGIRKPEDYGSYKAVDGVCDVTFDDNTSPSLKELTVFDTNSLVFLADDAAPGKTLYGMTGWEKLTSNKYHPLLEALYFRGPVAISIAASDIFGYESGIFDNCKDFEVNHAVTLVGYGKQGSDKYYLVQNSWGSWGEGGRIRIERKDAEEKHCGMDNKPLDGVACEGETDPVNVCGTCGILFDSVIPHFEGAAKNKAR